MKRYRIEKPFNLTIFGASGDLAKLKLFPALYSLYEQKRLPENFHIMGYARTAMTRKEFQKEFETSVRKNSPTPPNSSLLKKLLPHVHYFSGNYDQKEDFQKLRETYKSLNGRAAITHLAYFSVPPMIFKEIITNLGETRITAREDIRLILEKPFGEDAHTARELFHFVARYFDEESIYLLDHYLGKSGVQSILNLRHHNRMLNLMMKGPEVANIQITAAEHIGVTSRMGYFDQVGAIRDMLQSHLLQILALITMSIPITENTESLQREKYSILSALKFIASRKNIVIGQYEGYTKEKDAKNRSTTETFAAVRLFIDRESWYKTPIYLRTGKKLNEKHTYIVIEIKKFAFQPHEQEPNRLIIELQPDEKIDIKLINKHGCEVQELTTSDSIACEGDECLSEHAALLLDVFRKRKINFLSFAEIIASWELTDTITRFITKNRLKPERYKDYSEGPAAQHNLAKMDGFRWYDPH